MSATNDWTTPDLAAALERPDAPFVLDVRQPEEWNQGHIPGATLIPLGELPSRLAELPRDRDLAVICRSGGRSAMATMQLNQAGFKARNVAGGMLAWQGPQER